MRRIFALTMSAISCCLSAQASAGDINVLCKAEWSKRDGSKADIFRQYEITAATEQVSVYDNDGRGFTKQFTTRYQRADNSAVVIVQASNKYHELNRVTGMMFSV